MCSPFSSAYIYCGWRCQMCWISSHSGYCRKPPLARTKHAQYAAQYAPPICYLGHGERVGCQQSVMLRITCGRRVSSLRNRRLPSEPASSQCQDRRIRTAEPTSEFLSLASGCVRRWTGLVAWWWLLLDGARLLVEVSVLGLLWGIL